MMVLIMLTKMNLNNHKFAQKTLQLHLIQVFRFLSKNIKILGGLGNPQLSIFLKNILHLVFLQRMKCFGRIALKNFKTCFFLKHPKVHVPFNIAQKWVSSHSSSKHCLILFRALIVINFAYSWAEINARN